ncbi:bacitracin ABC transporter [Bifidobacterium dolichotidis]|uniref:Bacitracin ABC transporter n=1 Tax=Bifidobacterium dolichotidis TaxID=2306976 RepID=A0A430FQT9_9BIFI|nr:ATP-binding cassette domain-containing protein [Bifidobacterium dolichotidis]RSX55212.1 bacitracin ABC transporter [Bifidobacterium dolichotidis]
MDREKTNFAPSFEAVGLSLEYFHGKPVLNNLNLAIRGPQLIRLDAANGSGKSTLIEAASGYLRPSKGEVRINGHLAHDEAIRAQRRVCRSTPALHPNLSVSDHLVISANLAGVDRSEPLQRAERLGLEEWFGFRTNTLSMGTAKKLWFIMCSTGLFNVMFLDEPFNGVDQQSIEYMVSEINNWSVRSLVVLVSHTVPESLNIAQTVSLV